MSRRQRGMGWASPLVRACRLVVGLAALGAMPQIGKAEEAAAVVKKDDQGKGFKLGSARLHPYGDAQIHYLYNPGRAPAGSAAVNDLMLAPRGGVELEYPGSFVDLKLELEGIGRIYTGVEKSSTSNLTSFAGRLKTDALFNKEGAFTVRVSDELTPVTTDYNQTNNKLLTHTSNDASVTVDAKPGGGALVFTTSASFFIDYYHRTAMELNPQLQDNYRISPHFKASWKFLPKTAVFLDADLMVTNYYSDSNRSKDFDFIFKVHVGANGNITSKLSAVLKIGYGDTFSEVGSYRSVVGLAEMGYAIAETAKISLGYTRNVQPTSIFEFIGTDHTYARYSHLIAGMVQLEADIGFSYVQYGADPVQAAASTNGSIADKREDLRFVGNLSVDVYVLDDWLSVGLSERFEYNYSDYNFPDLAGVTGPSASYLTNDLFLRVMAKY